MRKIFFLSIAVSILLTGCYRTAGSSNGVAVVNAFSGDVFFPETREFVSYPEKEDIGGKYDYLSGYEYSFSDDSITPSGFNIQTSVRIDYDIVLYTVSISPTYAHVSEILKSESTDYYTPERSDIVERIIDDLRNERENVTISIYDMENFELASGLAFTSDATGILDANNIVSSIQMHGSFEIDPRFVDDAAFVSTSFTF